MDSLSPFSILDSQENCSKFEEEISAQCDELINAIVSRKTELFAFIAKEKDFKVKTLKEQVSSYTGKLQQTTGLLQFCIEALKETDPTSFLQVRAGYLLRLFRKPHDRRSNLVSPFSTTIASFSSVSFREQLGALLIQRAASAETSWRKDLAAAPWVSNQFEMTLDSNALITAVQQLTFKETKRESFSVRPLCIAQVAT